MKNLYLIFLLLISSKIYSVTEIKVDKDYLLMCHDALVSEDYSYLQALLELKRDDKDVLTRILIYAFKIEKENLAPLFYSLGSDPFYIPATSANYHPLSGFSPFTWGINENNLQICKYIATQFRQHFRCNYPKTGWSFFVSHLRSKKDPYILSCILSLYNKKESRCNSASDPHNYIFTLLNKVFPNKGLDLPSLEELRQIKKNLHALFPYVLVSNWCSLFDPSTLQFAKSSPRKLKEQEEILGMIYKELKCEKMTEGQCLPNIYR